MAAKGASTKSKTEPESVEAFLAGLEHPSKAGVEALRHVIRTADPGIEEGIKWKVPSFRTTEWFATMHLRAKTGFGVILHFGARKREGGRPAIADPAGLLTWLADDRAMVLFADGKDLQARKKAFTSLIQAWIQHV